jgi:hypothetical protein
MSFIFKEYFASNAEASYFFRDALPHIFAKTYKEVQGIFTKEELIVILTALKHEEITAVTSGKVLLDECYDFTRLHLPTLQNVIDTNKFLAKLRVLTIFQIVYLELWARKYWSEETPSNISIYASTLQAVPASLLQ